MPNDRRVAFAPNVPQQLAIKAAGESETGRSGDTVRYELVDGRTLHLTPDVATKISMDLQRTQEQARRALAKVRRAPGGEQHGTE